MGMRVVGRCVCAYEVERLLQHQWMENYRKRKLIKTIRRKKELIRYRESEIK